MDNGDFASGLGGGQVIITGAEKAAQDLLWESLHPYDPETDLGNDLLSATGQISGIVGDLNFRQNAVSSCLREATERLMRAQARSSLTSFDELIQQINVILVRASLVDPSRVEFFESVQVDGSTVQTARALGLNHLNNRSF